MAAGKPGDTPTAVIAQGTTPEQRVVRTTLAGLGEVDLASPAVIVIGPVAAMGESDPTESAAGPLAGRTVVVTRSGPRAKGLAEALEDAGATTVILPLTTQTDPSDGGAALAAAAAEVGRYQWVVLTSANAVHRFLGALRDARSLATTLVAAVGPATADALRMGGVEPDLVPAESWAQGLVEEFPDRDPELGEGRVLFPAADQAPDTIAEGLGQKGWDVTRVEAYRTVERPSPDPETLARAVAADAVTFTASSSVRAYPSLRGPDGVALPVPPCVVCIGPTTAATARELGLAGVEEAWGATVEGIVNALAHHLGPAGRPGS